MKKDDEQKIPSFRTMRFFVETENGSEVEITSSVDEVDEVDKVDEKLRTTSMGGTANFTIAMPEGQAARLRYWLFVRPRLFCPLEMRLN